MKKLFLLLISLFFVLTINCQTKKYFDKETEKLVTLVYNKPIDNFLIKVLWMPKKVFYNHTIIPAWLFRFISASHFGVLVPPVSVLIVPL
jgi:hypothetical protein